MKQQRTAAPAALHLLTLPREIRNRIYDYLGHEETPRHLGEWHVHTPKLSMIISLKTCSRLPLLSALLVHPKICDEYKEAACFRELTVGIVATSRDSHFYSEPPLAHPKRLSDPIIDNLLRATHVVISLGDSIHQDITAQEVIDVLPLNSMLLQSICVSFQEPIAVGLYHNPANIQKCWIHITDREPLNQIVLDHPLDKAMLGNPPNETRLSLPLAQQGVCLSLKEMDPSSHMLSRNTLVVYTLQDKNELFWSRASIMDWVSASCVLPYWTKDEFEKMPQEAMDTWITQLLACPLKRAVQEKDTTDEAV